MNNYTLGHFRKDPDPSPPEKISPSVWEGARFTTDISNIPRRPKPNLGMG